MRRFELLALSATITAAVAASSVLSGPSLRRAWPLRARVTGIGGRPAAFRAFVRDGAELVIVRPSIGLGPDGRGRPASAIPLGVADTLEATDADSLEVIVAPHVGGRPVVQRGRRLTVSHSSIGIEITTW